jgi:Mg-chelatase subunit ChlD
MSLLTPELLRRLEQFQLLAARRAKSSAKGERRSRARGQSVEFADHRSYVPGDDFRYLDWNLYGRLDKLFLKLYEEERELPVRIFLDASESMTFGEPRKFDFARQVAAAIGYVALCGFDRVSVIPFPGAETWNGGKGETFNVQHSTSNAEQSAIGNRQSAIEGALRSVRGKKSSMQFFHNLNALTAAGGADLNEALRRGALEARHTGLAIVLSDFLDPAGYEAGLIALVGRGFQVNCVQILAPEELAPTTFGDLRLVDSESGGLQEVTFGRYRMKAYQQTVQNFIQRLREFTAKRGINFFMAPSNMDLQDLLLKQLRKSEVWG